MEQSEGRRAVQWCNSTTQEVAESYRLNLARESSVQGQAVQHFLLRFRERISLLQRHSVMGRAQEGHMACFEDTALHI